MFGQDGCFKQKNNAKKAQMMGIIPRSIDELFYLILEKELKCTIYCSFLQIYNEKILDLLVGNQYAKPLKIREEKVQGIYVEGLTEYVVENMEECMNLLRIGEDNRIKRATKMNLMSSRSHSIF
jgi:kinesin family protein 3/17